MFAAEDVENVPFDAGNLYSCSFFRKLVRLQIKTVLKLLNTYRYETAKFKRSFKKSTSVRIVFLIS